MVLRSRVLFLSWISLPCMYSIHIVYGVISFCVLFTFLRLFDVIVVSRMISWLYFLMSALAFFLMVLRISTYSTPCLSAPFSTISRRFVIKVRVVDDILYFSRLSVALSTLDTLCWIMLWCRCCLVLVVSPVGFSIRAQICPLPFP